MANAVGSFGQPQHEIEVLFSLEAGAEAAGGVQEPNARGKDRIDRKSPATVVRHERAG
jgi:hypothetical protein